MKYIVNLRQIRKNKGLTQEEVAKKAGISFSTYVYVEKAQTKPNIITALKISKALNEPINRLFIYSNE